MPMGTPESSEIEALIRGLRPTRDPDPEKFAEEIKKSKIKRTNARI